MSAAEQLPETQHQSTEPGRLVMGARRTDDDGWCTLVVVQEDDGSWTVQVPGAPGVVLERAGMVALAEAILVRAR